MNLNRIFKKNKRSEPGQPRACFLYYMIFNNSALLYREAKALAEKGYAVDIVALRRFQEDKVYQQFHGLNIYHIQARPASETNFKVYFLRIIWFFIKSTFLLSYWGIRRGYDLIHVTAPPDFMVFAAVVPKLLGAKIILDIHDIGPELYMRKLAAKEDRLIIRTLKYIEKISARFSDHVITVTEFWRQKLVARSISEDRCTVLLNVPDSEVFRPLSVNRQKESKQLNLFYHGSMEEHFGVDTLLQAMPLIAQKIPQVKLHIYGGGRLEDNFKDYAKKNGLNGHVIFFGRVPFYKLPQILADADVGIVPTKDSVFSEETVSMKSFEYLFLGIPIIISKTKAHCYYYDNSMVKFFEPGNKQELAEAVIALHQNNGEKEHMMANSRKFIEKYGWDESKKIYYQIVDQITNHRKD